MAFWNHEDKWSLLGVFCTGFVSIIISKIVAFYLVGLDPFYITTITVLLLKETGIALMIASVLGYTVEEFSRAKLAKERREFTENVSKDVLSAVFKTIVPDAIFNEIKHSVLEQTLVKRNAHLSYVLTELTPADIRTLELTNAEAKSYLKCELTTRHKLINLSDVPRGHTIKNGISCDLSSKLSKHVTIHSAFIREELNAIELKKHTSDIENADGVILFEYETTLEGEEELDVCFCSTTFKKVDDTEVWTTLVPTENMYLDITFPDGLKIDATSNHSKKLTKGPCNNKANRVIYELEYGVFPHQGITFWWRKF